MAHPQTKHFVVLRSGMSEAEEGMFRKFAKKVESGTDESLLGFECVSVQVSDHSYIVAEVIWDSRQWLMTVRFPSYLVLAIFDIRPDQKHPLGFYQ